MAKNLNQIATAATSISASDKMYIARSPFSPIDDRYILGSSIIAQFVLASSYPVIGATSGKIVISNGTIWVASTPTYPNTASVAGALIISNGTNYIQSTSLWPNTVGTSGKLVISNGTSNVYSTSTFEDTYALGTILIASTANTISGFGPLTNGQLIVGSTGAAPSAATITAGANISVTNGSGSITIAATGTASFSYTNVVSGTQTMAANTGYIANNLGSSVAFTLPATSSVGTVMEIVGSCSGGWTITQLANQVIHNAGTSTTTGVGGSVTTGERYDCIKLICIVANLEWSAYISGNITFN